jgi:ribosomal RNA-processing protein 7
MAEMSKIPSKIGDYDILPITLPPTPAFPVKATHHIFIRRHAPKIPTPSDSRSLFLVNVPIDSTEAHFRAVFTSLVGTGRFQSITFENERHGVVALSGMDPAAGEATERGDNKKRKRGNEGRVGEALGQLPKVWDRDLHHSGSTAIVLMVDERSAEIALKAVRKLHKRGACPVWGAGVEGKVPALGPQRYLNHHILSSPSREVLQASVDAFMTEFNRKEEEAARAAKKMRSVPDEDGFITVTRGGRTGPARREEAEEARRKELRKEEERRKSMGDFYRFQARERRKQEQGELVKRFEEDRKRVEEMRKGRKGRFIPE